MSRAAVRFTSSEGGSAVVEFVILGVLVMIPVAYVAVVALQLQSATFGVVTAAREAGRAYVTSQTTSQAAARARHAATIAMADHGMPAPEVVIRCLGGTCLSPGSRVQVEVSVRVAIPFVPSQAIASAATEGDHDDRATIPVSAIHEAVVDTYRQSQ